MKALIVTGIVVGVLVVAALVFFGLIVRVAKEEERIMNEHREMMED